MKKPSLSILSTVGLLFIASVNAVAPTITNVSTINPATYDNAGDVISFDVHFDQIVNVNGGVPELKFRSPSNLTKKAGYNSGTGTNTLTFNYVVGTDLNLNDWNGIEIPNINLVKNGATIQNIALEEAVYTVHAANFAGIKIDSKAPTWDRIELSSLFGNISGNTRYIPGGSSVTTYSFLTENDTRSVTNVGLKVGGGVAQVINYTGSNINGQDKDAQKSGILNGDGVVTLDSYLWTDQAGKNATGIPNFIIKDVDPAVLNYIIDSTNPILSNPAIITPTNDNTPDFSFNSTEAGTISMAGSCSTANLNVVSGANTITLNVLADGTYIDCDITATDTAGNISNTLEIPDFTIDSTNPTITINPNSVFTADNPINVSFVFSKDVTGFDIGDIDVTNGTKANFAGINANYSVDISPIADGDITIEVLANKATDSAGNGNDQKSVTVKSDRTGPTGSITNTSGNPTSDNMPTLNLSIADTGVGIAGAKMQFSCDAVNFSAWKNYSNTKSNFNIQSGNNGCLNTDGTKKVSVRFQDSLGNIGGIYDTGDFILDATAPVLSNPVIITPTSDTTPDFSFNSTEAGTISMVGSCSTANLNVVGGVNTITLNALADGTYTDCDIAVTDVVGNVSLVLEIPDFNIDTTSPDFSNIGVVSNNPYDNNYAKADSVLTFTLTLTNPDSYDGNGNITFEINGISKTINFVDPANSVKKSDYTATFDLTTFGSLVDNAIIKITGVNFADFVNHNITNFVTGPPAPTVIVDTKSPKLTTVTANTNGNGGIWAKNNKIATFLLGFSEEIIRGNLNSASTANNASVLNKEFNINNWGTSDNIQFTVRNGDNGIITFNKANFSIVDHAGNTTLISEGDINILNGNIITADTTRPTITNVSIFSDNALDTTLAKTNDTIIVRFDTNDNLSPTTILVTSHANILNKVVVDGATGPVGINKIISRFTDGTETSEIIVPFSTRIKDEAGNWSTVVTTTNNGSKVRFDRTDPIVQSVKISATSIDNTAYMGNAPVFYAKKGDTLDFELQVCDYVDSQNNPPSGTIFNQAVVMNNIGQTGAACVTPEGNPSIWRKWKTQLVGIDGIEGIVIFNIDVKDNAGNVLINVTGTTDGSSIIFDKTVPLNPTDVRDTLGAEILSFKHRYNAQFNWTNDIDDTSNTPIVSGVQNYNIRFTNSANGGEIHRNERINSRNFDGRISNLVPWNRKAIPPRDVSTPYDFHIQTRDKAGNDSLEEITYTQPYTIGFTGKVIDSEGNPLADTNVQVVARYGETCDYNREICTGITNSNGEYAIVSQKDQKYNITYFHQIYYLAKYDKELGHDDDVVINPNLNGLTFVHEQQTSNQGIEIITSEKFIGDDGKLKATKLWVYSFSGEINHKNIDGEIIISSLSRITLIKSNNPAVIIRNNGNNIYTIINAGRVQGTGGIDNPDDTSSGGGTASNYSSGSFRIGTKYIASNGNPKNTFGKYKTPAEWDAYAKRLKEGVPHKVITYTNRNGYKIFAGYRSGLIGWEKFPKRFQNQVKFRGISRNRSGSLKSRFSQNKPVLLAKRLSEMKKNYQRPTIDKKKAEQEKLATIAPLGRVTQKTAYKGVLAKRLQKSGINKFERKSSFAKKTIPNRRAGAYKVIKIKFTNGTGVSMERFLNK